MKIVRSAEVYSKFKDLNVGDVFDFDSTIYMKFKNAVCHDNAVVLSDGVIRSSGNTNHLCDDELVRKLEAVLTVR